MEGLSTARPWVPSANLGTVWWGPSGERLYPEGAMDRHARPWIDEAWLAYALLAREPARVVGMMNRRYHEVTRLGTLTPLRDGVVRCKSVVSPTGFEPVFPD